jgi:hypothetical protein
MIAASPVLKRTWLRRWIAIGVVVFMGWLTVNWLCINRTLFERARKIRIGQTEQEVRVILGTPDIWTLRSNSPAIERFHYGSLQAYWDLEIIYPFTNWLSQWSWSCNAYCSGDDYPVEVLFDPEQWVRRIRYGRTVITK